MWNLNAVDVIALSCIMCDSLCFERQFSSTILPDGVPVTVSMRGGEGAKEMYT